MEHIQRHMVAPGDSFFLFGPRGTGKSTWLKATFPDAVFVDLLKSDLYRRLKARPETFAEFVKARPGARTFVVDEVQRVPEVLETVHSLMEAHRGVRFVLTGSSARKLKRAGVDLLAGRALRLCVPMPTNNLLSKGVFYAKDFSCAVDTEHSFDNGTRGFRVLLLPAFR